MGGRLLIVALLLATTIHASPLGLDSTISADSSRNGAGDYTAQQYIVDSGGTLTFVNAALGRHDVVARDGGGSGDHCQMNYVGRHASDCPLFASPLIGTGEAAVVAGISAMTPGSTYEFYCTLHSWMKGEILAL